MNMDKSLSNLYAVILGHRSQLIIQVWKNGDFNMIFDSGNRCDGGPRYGDETTPEDVISGMLAADNPLVQMGENFTVHRVPTELQEDMDVLQWLSTNVPELEIVWQQGAKA